MKVFVLTMGEYSDYTVVGVCSTEELAEQRRQEIGGDTNDPIEFEVDGVLNRDGEALRKEWICRLRLDTGEVIEESVDNEFASQAGVAARGRWHGWPGRGDVVGHSYESAEHAQKLASEGRQSVLRQAAQDEAHPVQCPHCKNMVPPHRIYRNLAHGPMCEKCWGEVMDKRTQNQGKE